MKRMSRREFIRTGLAVSFVSLFVKAPFRLFSSEEVEPWVAPIEARVSFIFGEFFINGKKAEVGANIVEGDIIRTGDRSEAEIEVKNYAIFHMKENTVIEINNIVAKGRVKVKSGWFLGVIKKGKEFQVSTPTVLAGVRGTVLFVNVFSDDSAYLCDCNGKVDIIDPRSMNQLKTVESEYHTAFNIKKAGKGVQITRAGQLYHHDSDILKMAKRFPQETKVFKDRNGGGRY
ncbi:MAG: FecR domain-containing protein [Spirochaetota bacterium]|nr:MAG: FecR domain-containing protein [Spirochaetota bacterium]